jgi:hypothetical protein
MWRKSSERADEFFSLSIKHKQIRQRFDNARDGRPRFNQRVAEMGHSIDDDLDEAFGPEPDDERF